jgi:uncharacterized membrane protein
MAYDQLSRPWRIAYAIIGTLLAVAGVLGAVAEVYLALSGFPLAWFAVLILVPIALLGFYLIYAVRQGRIRTLGLGAGRGR